MELSVFDRFPEPVFFLQEKKLAYSNAAALALEPDWTAGSPIPEGLSVRPDKEGVFSCTLWGEDYQASVTPVDDGRLLVLRRAVKIPDAAVLAALPIQLREQLNNIQACARLLSPLAEESGDERVKRHLAMLQQSFYRLLRLARHMELAGQARREDFSHVAEDIVDLAELCRETAYGAVKLAERAGVTFQDEVPGGVMPCVGDRDLLEIMLLELISNAIKAAGRGGQAGLHLSFDGSRVLLTVWDSGDGIDQPSLTAIMDGTSPESLPKPGTGLRLGLPIARYAAAAHGGAILLESQEGHGLRATASLPLKKPYRGSFRTPRPGVEEGFPSLLTFLADALPWTAFEE